jgi:hypothetical protein
MSFEEDELLVRALGGLGGKGGARGARRLPKDVLEVDLVVSMSPQAAADRARQVISRHGSVLNLESLNLEGIGEDPDTQVIGIVGSGIAKLNPAVVTVTIRATEDGSRLVIRGAAKEGLIKQRAGEKAARLVAAEMASAV